MWYRLTMRKRLAVFASIALVGWLLAFASHIHLPDERAAGKPAPPHSCLFCAVLQPGAGSVAIPQAVTPTQPEWFAAPEPSSLYRASFLAAYRSRAPPIA